MTLDQAIETILSDCIRQKNHISFVIPDIIRLVSDWDYIEIKGKKYYKHQEFYSLKE